MSESTPHTANGNLGGRPPHRRASTSLLAHGEPMVWLTGGALALALLMILGLLALIVYNGSTTFWPGHLYEVHTVDGETFLGELTRTDEFTVDVGMLDTMAPAVRQRVEPRLIGPLDRRLDHAEAAGEQRLARFGRAVLADYGEHFMARLMELGGMDEPAGGRALWKVLHEHVDPLVAEALEVQIASLEQEAEPDSEQARRLALVRRVLEEEGDRAIRRLQAASTAQVSPYDDDLRRGIAPLLEQARRQVGDALRARLTGAMTAIEFEAAQQAAFAHELEELTAEALTPDALRIVLREAAAGEHGVDAGRIAALLDGLEPRIDEYGRTAILWEIKALRQQADAVERIREALEAQSEGYPAALEQAAIDPDLPLLAKVRILLTQVYITATRRLYRTGNYDLPPQTDFTWIPDYRVADDGVQTPEWGLLFEREEWGRFYGYPVGFVLDGEVVATEPGEIWALFQEHHGAVRRAVAQRRSFEKYDLGRLARIQEEKRLSVEGARLRYQPPPAWIAAYNPVVEAKRPLRVIEAARGHIEALESQLDRLRSAADADEQAIADTEEAIAHWMQVRDDGEAQRAELVRALTRAEAELRVTEAIVGTADPAYIEAVEAYETLRIELMKDEAPINRKRRALQQEVDRYGIALRTARGQQATLQLGDIARAYAPNQLNTSQRWGVYFSRWGEFLTDDPRDANMEGGVLPAIFGTVTMTLLMSIVVVPFGVLAALYLREYARAGPMISALRIAINNLAGVPSIVFGVFGMGFFIYTMGAWIDQGPRQPMNTTNWWWGVGLVAVLTVGAVLIGLFGRRLTVETIPGRTTRLLGGLVIGAWVAASLTALALIAWNPYFGGFYAEKGDVATFRTGGVLWASLTLALLTLPVVIVATEEALAAVPSSMREGSYACGASKWQTIRRIVLPRAMPGIMTGMILAMARGAGEVAPLMLVGAVMLAPSLPVDFHNLSGSLGPVPTGPVHLERSFMHLGFHIYDIGFQSRDSEAARPMVYTTTLLLIAIVTALNLAAIMLRSRLSKKFVSGQF